MSWPVVSPVNASSLPLRVTPHDSGPVWLAIPSPYDSFIHYISLVLPAHGAPSFAESALSLFALGAKAGSRAVTTLVYPITIHLSGHKNGPF